MHQGYRRTCCPPQRPVYLASLCCKNPGVHVVYGFGVLIQDTSSGHGSCGAAHTGCHTLTALMFEVYSKGSQVVGMLLEVQGIGSPDVEGALVFWMEVMFFRLTDLQMLILYHKKPWKHGSCRTMERGKPLALAD